MDAKKKKKKKLERKKDYVLLLSSETDLRAIRVKNNILTLEEDITKDRHADTLVGLETAQAIARAIVKGLVVEQITADGRLVATDGEGDGGQGVTAREGVSLLATARTGHLLVVGFHDIIIDHEQSGTRIGNCIDRARADGAASNPVSIGGEPPVSFRAVDVGVGDRARVLAVVEEAEIVRAGFLVLQDHGKQGFGKLGLDIVEPRLLRGRLDLVDGTERETHQAIAALLCKFGTDFRGCLDGLLADRVATDRDLVQFHVTAGAAAVLITDLPRPGGFVGSRGTGCVDVVSTLGTGREGF